MAKVKTKPASKQSELAVMSKPTATPARGSSPEAELQAACAQYGPRAYMALVKIRNLYKQEIQAPVIARHRLGQEFLRMRDGEAFAPHAAEAIAEMAGLKKWDVLERCRIADSYTTADLQRFLQFENSRTKEPLPIAILGMSCAIRDKTKRFALLAKYCRDGWNIERLQREIAGLNGHKTPGKGFAIPQSLGAMLRQVDAKGAQLEKYIANVPGKHLEEAVANTSPEQVTPELISEAEQLEASLEKLKESLDETRTEIAVARKRLQDIHAAKVASGEPIPTPKPKQVKKKKRIAPGRTIAGVVPPPKPKKKN